MQPIRLGFWTALRTAERCIHPLRHPRPSPFLPRAQTRNASYRYRRFGDETGQQKWSNSTPIYRWQYHWRTYRTRYLVGGTAGGIFYVVNLEEAPNTHRRRFNCVSPELEAYLGNSQYQGILDEYRGKILAPNHPHTQAVARVVERLLPSAHLPGSEQWHIHVIDDPKQKNAFVIPGGKVFVFTGILPITEDEAGLAAVLGHEIAHNVQHHVAEKLSNSIIVAGGAAGIALFFETSGQTALAIANLVLSLPNSRAQEMEADRVGLLLMAESCYDPEAAVDLWTRMAKAEEFSPPQFLSTHPTSYNRRELIKNWLPEAKQKYDEANCGTVSRYTKDFKEAFQTPAQSQGQSLQPQTVYIDRGKQSDDDDFF